MPLRPSEIVKDGLYYSEETENYYLVLDVDAHTVKFAAYSSDDDRPVKTAESRKRLFAGIMTERCREDGSEAHKRALTGG